jgi:hypothetical protein
LQNQTFTEIAECVDARRMPQCSYWLGCHIEKGAWHGAGDETKLERILEVFLAWAEEKGG